MNITSEEKEIIKKLENFQKKEMNSLNYSQKTKELLQSIKTQPLIEHEPIIEHIIYEILINKQVLESGLKNKQDFHHWIQGMIT